MASNDFEIDCVVKEGKNTLIELKLSAATEEMAEKMCDNWEKASKEIYEFAMKKLFSFKKSSMSCLTSPVILFSK